MLTFGPVLSRRFGMSLGVNPFPEKLCTYACVYCQLGPGRVTLERKPLCDPKALEEELKGKKGFDVITYVPKGEPQLDANLGECGKVMRKFGKAVLLTNGSLSFLDEVREAMKEFDVVSVKVDAGREGTWRRVNRPHALLKFDEVLDGIKRFAREFDGTLVTETMILKGYNDSEEELRAVAEIIGELKPAVAYLSGPVRPPWEPVEEGNLSLALKIISEVANVVVLGKGRFEAKGDLREVAKVHPVPLKAFGEVPEGCEVVERGGEEYVRC